MKRFVSSLLLRKMVEIMRWMATEQSLEVVTLLKEEMEEASSSSLQWI